MSGDLPGTVLVANRGEIALRVIRTCREMGIRTVAVYSSADADSAAVRSADTAVHIGPAAPRHSYLFAPAIIEAARRTGADAIHPGYGFLSEDPDFAEICAEHALTFIGPRPEVMSELGDKARARAIMAGVGVPVLPGSDGAVESVAEAVGVADRIGFPVMIKAVAGGGGRGMTVVADRGELPAAFRATRSAAQAVFGDGRVYLERYCERARHVEVQVLADTHGTTLSLGERDCSVQRRHQKLVEETPAPNLPPAIADRLAEAAVRGARAIGYTSLATFEFLVHDDGIAFMEINCRIQVEHPVTEMVTGIDLVREQIRVAAGLPVDGTLGARRTGCAVECRVNAEDTTRGFAPAPGVLDEFVPPGGPFVRVDTHARQGWRVPPEYDSLLAKVVTWGTGRQEALDRMDRALAEFRVGGPGVRTTRRMLRAVLADSGFRSGTHTTTFLDERDADLMTTAMG